MKPLVSMSTPVWGFNPRPPLLAGEWPADMSPDLDWEVSIHARHCWRANDLQQCDLAAVHLVSIHARHCWRANEGCARCAAVTARFNPRPPLLAGECVGAPKPGAGKDVSIHARHCWRANAASAAPAALPPEVSIHARHCWRANEAASSVTGGRLRFQSTPAIAGGRMRTPYG